MNMIGAPARYVSLSSTRDVVAFHFKGWKHGYLRAYFPDKNFYFTDIRLNKRKFWKNVAPRLASANKPIVFVWGQNLPEYVELEILRLGIEVFFLEDGFIRSTDSHSGYSAPLSLIFDRQRPYFDARGPSDLEDILNAYDFEAAPELLIRAEKCIDIIKSKRVTKYNGADGQVPQALVRGDHHPSILVIGQVEEDASIKFGCVSAMTNNDLIKLAAKENPGATIVYKPHPDVLNKMRKRGSNPSDVRNLCSVLNETTNLHEAFDAVDHVYTITSLAGFEALLHGKRVTVVGSPFYAGWGLTDDRQHISRRRRKRAVVEVFAAAYLLYPAYFNNISGSSVSLEDTLEHVVSDRGTKATTVFEQAVTWKPIGSYGLLGWRHLMSPFVSWGIGKLGNRQDVALYRRDPIRFFRELNELKYRVIGRLLYPWG